MKTKHIILNILLIALALCALNSCADVGPMKVGVCKDDVCIDFTIPARAAKPAGKAVVPVQPALP